MRYDELSPTRECRLRDPDIREQRIGFEGGVASSPVLSMAALFGATLRLLVALCVTLSVLFSLAQIGSVLDVVLRPGGESGAVGARRLG
jgi:hypothetical protein